MLKLNDLRAPRGANRKIKRVGRGPGSGHGKTLTCGHKGQKARSGPHIGPWFEGGQMPLQRRVPKRGFTNIFRREYAVVNVDQLSDIPAGTEVNVELLAERGIVGKPMSGLKVLGRGELKSALTVRAAAFSESAKQKIEAAGGKAEVIGG